jgi:hypothetical protein
MVSLGRVYALDMFLNNCDRFPLNVKNKIKIYKIWPNEGNSENLLLRFTSNDFIPHTEFKKKEYMNLEFEVIFFPHNFLEFLRHRPSNDSIMRNLITKLDH